MKQVKSKKKASRSASDDIAVVVMLFLIIAIAGALLFTNGCATTVANPSTVKSDKESKRDSEHHFPGSYYRDFR